MSLPPPYGDQAYCYVSALEAGHLDIPCHLVITDVPKDEVNPAPIIAFILHHSKTNANFLVDLGIRRDLESYPPAVREHIRDAPVPVRISQDVVQSLEKGGLLPSQITDICLTHVHWDHVGDPNPFTNATFLVGEESRSLFDPGYPADPKSAFAADLLPLDRTKFLSKETWAPLGPFPHALDFFGDGSLYIVDAPGHLPGHVNILARTSSDGGWIYLAGDSAHDWRLLRGEAKISGSHVDPHVAGQHIERIKALMEIPRVRVVLAHDTPWYTDNRDGPAYWPGHIESL
ncbi:hypothetical protein JAAARDRAFT_30309 [Jaapia argillacea MUCL 33604]|uniref:Metallo-beta-lactamase domain-containing protein n=1 Tax=Jaapia argillacea MUCL 33604 TaxID=933084 RepID=A0A067QIH6_9AGAM|nr:hypothetical protein JAAARDRAFT_30309 [Jaapia argillacea MUCL 33604]